LAPSVLAAMHGPPYAGNGAAALRLLADVMGIERVMLGSDYPFPLGEQRIGQLIGDAAAFSAQQRDLMLNGNARAFFAL